MKIDFSHFHFFGSIYIILGIIILTSLFFPILTIWVSTPILAYEDGNITSMIALTDPISNYLEMKRVSLIFLIFSPIPDSDFLTYIGFVLFASIVIIIFLGILQVGIKDTVFPSVLILIISGFLIFFLQSQYIAIEEGYKYNFLTLDSLSLLETSFPILYSTDNAILYFTLYSEGLPCLSYYDISLESGFFMLLTLMITTSICSMVYIIIARKKLIKELPKGKRKHLISLSK